MEIQTIARLVNEKASLYDDRELAFVAQQLDLYASMKALPRLDPASALALVSVPGAAKILSLSVDYVWKLVASGQLKSIKIGKRRLIKHAELMRFADSATTHWEGATQ
jgi:excisionase family DNA binding protein